VAVTGLPPTLVVGGRLGLGAAVLLALVLVLRRRLPGGWRPWTFFVAIALLGNLLPFNLISWGQQHIDSALAGILMAVMPLITLTLAHFFIEGETLTPNRVLGFLAGFAGIVVLTGPSALSGLGRGDMALLGQMAVLGGAVCYGLASIVSRLAPERDALVAAASVLLLGTLFMLPFSATVPGMVGLELHPQAVAAVALLGVFSTALATVMYFKLMRIAGPSFVSLINYLIPLWAVALGVILLGERPEPSDLLALVIILFGIALSQWRGRRRAVPLALTSGRKG
jgi:drug/metabolite transporter (DMT)-like permease